MQPVEVEPRTVDSYRDVAGAEAIDRLRSAAEPLRDARVLHVNATPDGGGVAELLRSEMALLCDLGLACDWYVMSAPPPFFEVTKAIHNRLQGLDGPIQPGEHETWLEWQQKNADALRATGDEYDVVVVHDPQPMGLPAFGEEIGSHWIWRLHIDSSTPHPEMWALLRPYLDPYCAAVFTLSDFVPPGVSRERVQLMAPAIDPLIEKNQPLSLGEAQEILRRLGIDPGRTLVAQISRLDPWKDPIGVIDVFRAVRADHPGLQLALLGAMEASDDPEAARVATDVLDHADDDPDIHIYTDPDQIGPPEVGAVQLLANVVLQKSLREGFGLTVGEAMWKGTPVVATDVGGIPLQLQDGVGGFLVGSTEEAAERTGWLLSHPAEARSIGAAGRAQIRDHFLITRLLSEELALYSTLHRETSHR
jgi:trehalose synthase